MKAQQTNQRRNPQARKEYMSLYMKRRYLEKRDQIKTYQKIYYQKHAKEISEARRPYQRQFYLKGVAKQIAYILRSGGQCIDCENEEVLLLQYHHRDPLNKVFPLGDALKNKRNGRSLQEIDEEIAKCDLLCPNCHALRHRTLSPKELNETIQLAKKYFSETEGDNEDAL